MMRCALIFRFAVIVTAVAGYIENSIAAEEPLKRPNCAFIKLNGFAFVDDHTAVLEYANQDAAPAERRLWFKVTFANSCPRLKQARFVDMKTGDCPKLGDVLKFSSRPFAGDDNDSCRIDTAEQIPVGSRVLPKPS